MPDRKYTTDDINDMLDDQIKFLEDTPDDIGRAGSAKEAFDIYIDAIRSVLNSDLMTGYAYETFRDEGQGDQFNLVDEKFAAALQHPQSLWEQIESIMEVNDIVSPEDQLDYMVEGLPKWVSAKINLLKQMYI